MDTKPYEPVMGFDFKNELSETHWLAKKAILNLTGCLASWKYQGSKYYRPTSEYLTEALEFTEKQLAEALERVKELRKKVTNTKGI